MTSGGAQSQPGSIGMIQQDSATGHTRRLRTRVRNVFHNRRQVQDQHYMPVAEDGGAVYQISRESVVVQSLDDQLFFAFQSVDSQTVLPLADGNDQDEQLARFAVGIGAGGRPRRSTGSTWLRNCSTS